MAFEFMAFERAGCRPPTCRLIKVCLAARLRTGPDPGDTACGLALNREAEMTEGGKIEIANVLQPGHRYRVDKARYGAMRQALMAVLPGPPAALTVAEAKAALLPVLDQALFPGGDKAGWWLKAVQLDLEAKGEIARMPGSPVRLHRIVTGN